MVGGLVGLLSCESMCIWQVKNEIMKPSQTQRSKEIGRLQYIESVSMQQCMEVELYHKHYTLWFVSFFHILFNPPYSNSCQPVSSVQQWPRSVDTKQWKTSSWKPPPPRRTWFSRSTRVDHAVSHPQTRSTYFVAWNRTIRGRVLSSDWLWPLRIIGAPTRYLGRILIM